MDGGLADPEATNYLVVVADNAAAKTLDSHLEPSRPSPQREFRPPIFSATVELTSGQTATLWRIFFA